MRLLRFRRDRGKRGQEHRQRMTLARHGNQRCAISAYVRIGCVTEKKSDNSMRRCPPGGQTGGQKEDRPYGATFS